MNEMAEQNRNIQRLYSLPVPYLYVLAIVTYYLLSFLHYFTLIELLGVDIEENDIEQLGTGKIISALLVAPLLETLIFQFGIVGLLFKWTFFDEWKGLTIFISASLFALSHNYQLHSIIYFFFGGVIFAQFYLIMRERKHAVWHTAALHILINLCVLIKKSL
ncbi:CPBP family intramembrane glutamic endopeptidase [Sphingobacterium sp. xlx-130]|uniref:CPBP family intramembrane glutamic endopeptidase n=2 Tax=Sphingobacteriaceae TaxID=84566 RepID=UPI0013D96355|nr:CPBP family intramembrane glutamic endopeptidase [Sphingobacterium sp. xlx-130]